MTQRYYKALQHAIKAHDGQYDKGGEPYILHSLYVSSLMDTDDEEIVALFHDTIEDTDYTLEDIDSWGFGELVDAVDCISKRKEESYDEYILRVCSNKMSLKVKIADMKHNSDLSRIKEATGKDRLRNEKYNKWLPVLEKQLKILNSELLISPIDMDEVSTNKYGVNEKIRVHITSEEEMKRAGFRKTRNKWVFTKDLTGEDEIGLYVTINEDDPRDLDIQVIDENFGQPYDYQYILNRSNNEFALRIKELVEVEIERLQSFGVISGHLYGEYI